MRGGMPIDELTGGDLGRGTYIHPIVAAKNSLMEHLELDRVADPENDHCEAERLLMAFLRASNENAIADAWDKAKSNQNWWYA